MDMAPTIGSPFVTAPSWRLSGLMLRRSLGALLHRRSLGGGDGRGPSRDDRAGDAEEPAHERESRARHADPGARIDQLTARYPVHTDGEQRERNDAQSAR